MSFIINQFFSHTKSGQLDLASLPVYLQSSHLSSIRPSLNHHHHSILRGTPHHMTAIMANTQAIPFTAATAHAAAHPAIATSNTDKLKLYALYKQATIGPCNTAPPSAFFMIDRAKHDAWTGLGQMTSEEAKLQYVAHVSKLDPTFQAPPPATSDDDDNNNTDTASDHELDQLVDALNAASGTAGGGNNTTTTTTTASAAPPRIRKRDRLAKALGLDKFRDALKRDEDDTTDTTTTATTDEYYLGKNIVKLKRAIRQKAKEKTLEADTHLLRPADSSHDPRTHAVGEITITIDGLTDLPKDLCHSPYCRIMFEGTMADTSRSPTGQPFSPWTRTFHVTDVEGNVVIAVYASRYNGAAAMFTPALAMMNMHDELVGKVIISLSHLCGYHGLLNQGHLESWFELLPLKQTADLYTCVVDGVPSSGLSRPTTYLGKVKVNIDLRLTVSLPEALLFVSPFRPIAPDIPGMPINVRALRGGKNRLQRVLKSISLRAPLSYLFSWTNPRATGCFMACVLLCTMVETWQLPFFLAVMGVAWTWWWAKMRPDRVIMPPKVFGDETPEDPDIPKNIKQKLRALIKLAELMQFGMCKVASMLERVVNLLSWEDEAVSFIMATIVMISGLIISFLLMLLSIFFSNVLSAVWCMRLLVVGMFAMSSKLMNERIVQVSDRILWSRLGMSSGDRDDESLSITGGGRPSSSTSEPILITTIERSFPTDGDEVDPVLATFESSSSSNDGGVDVSRIFSSLPKKDLLRLAIRNFTRRLVDEREMEHRRVAKSREIVSG